MEKTYESKRHRLEENYWLFKARRDIILKIIQKTGGKPDSKILDVGCAGGHLIKFLKENGFRETHGIDISNEAISLCKKRGLKNVSIKDCLETKFKRNTFDIITADNVLEHLEDDERALNEWNRILKKDGTLIILVPAFNFLWSQHDEVCHHYRRYSKASLIKLLRKTHFKVDKSSYWNLSLFFPASLVRVFQRVFSKGKKQKDDQLYELNPLVNKTLFYLLKLENWLVMRLNFPVGISVFGVARKY